MTDWDDLRYFLAIARSGGIVGASKSLNVNYSTAVRRLNCLEERVGVRLFKRLPSNYELTIVGHKILASALQIESEFNTLNSEILGRNTVLAGVVRLATTDVIASRLIPIFQRFLILYSGIQLEVVTSTRVINLAGRDADIALSITNTPPENLVTRKVAEIDTALYVSRNYLERHPDLTRLEDQTWIGWDENCGLDYYSSYMNNLIPKNAKIACRVSSGIALRDAVSAGTGIGYLWCCVGDEEQQFCRARPGKVYPFGLWALIHKDRYNTTRYRAFIDYIEECLANLH